MSNLFVTGDPVDHLYLHGSCIIDIDEFETQYTIESPGGAMNSCHNALTMAERTLSPGEPIERVQWCVGWHNHIIRTHLVSGTDELASFWSTAKVDDHYDPFYAASGIPINKHEQEEPAGLLINDQNLGMVNRMDKDVKASLANWNFKFVVVQSNTKTLDLAWLEQTDLKILVATDNSYNLEWAQNFDYVVVSNGPAHVRIVKIDNRPESNSCGYITIANLPCGRFSKDGWQRPALDTSGAGDTLAAAIALYLARYKGDIGIAAQLVTAAVFGIDMCQEAIQQRRHAVPKTTLVEWEEKNCTSQTKMKPSRSCDKSSQST